MVTFKLPLIASQTLYGNIRDKQQNEAVTQTEITFEEQKQNAISEKDEESEITD